MADCGHRSIWRPHCTRRPGIHVKKGAIWGTNYPNSQLSANIHVADPPVVRHVGIREKKIPPGSGVTASTNRKLPQCTSTAQIGYWNGRIRAPNFLAMRTVLAALLYMSKSARFSARTCKIPDFLGNVFRSGPHLARQFGVPEK